MSPLCECYIASPFMEMNRLETGVTHAKEVGDKGLLGCSVTEMCALNCTFSSSLPAFFLLPSQKYLKQNSGLWSPINLSVMPIRSAGGVQYAFRVVFLQ